jgi:hypothetical protein
VAVALIGGRPTSLRRLIPTSDGSSTDFSQILLSIFFFNSGVDFARCLCSTETRNLTVKEFTETAVPTI